MSLSVRFQPPVIALIERQYPDTRIIANHPPPDPSQQLYIHAPNLQLSIGELRFIAEATEVSVADAEAVAQRIHNFMTTLIDTLENNQACRLSWSAGAVRGREREGRINLRELETQINILKQLVQQCRHGVTCKSDLTDLLNRRRGEIFRTVDDARLLRNLRQLRLPELPENYEHLPLLNEDSYEIIYESILQKLLVYQNAVGQFLRRELGFDDFQRICFELMRQDIVLLNNNKTNELIRYVWDYCTQQYLRFTRMRARIRQLRQLLIDSLLRTYYIAFQAKMQIQELEQSLNAVERELIGSNGKSPQPSAMGRNSVAASSGQDAIVRLQNNFTSIFNYLTQKNETIFLNFYQRKLKKRVTKLLQIEERLTHFFKIIFNPDYADTQTKQQQQDPQLKVGRVDEKYKQVRELSEELKPMNEKQFKLVFEEIQRLGIFVEETKAGREWEYKVVELEKRVMSDYLFDKNGQRKLKKESPMERFAKSRVAAHDRSFNSYEVNKDEVFEDTIEEINKKRLSITGQGQQQPLLNIPLNREEVWREGQQLIDSIRPEFGEQFMDLTNFKAYLLTKLTKKVETALSQTQYGEQPLYLHLTSLMEILNILPTIIKPEINEKKIDLIFFPKVNSQLFSTLKAMMAQHQYDLSAVYMDLSNNPIKAKNLPPSIKGFMENRLRYLHVLLENIDKLEQIAITVDGLHLKKISHDVTSEATYNLVLKLLLASKEIKAYQDSIRDRINNKNLSAKALKLLSEYIYPNFLNSLLLVFENNRRQQSPLVLQALLQLSQASRKVMEESEQYMDTIVRMIEDVLGRRVNADVRLLLQEYCITLRAYNSRAEELINQCYNYSCINSDALNRQRIRILEFLELLYNGPRTTAEIIDQKSKRLQGLLGQLP